MLYLGIFLFVLISLLVFPINTAMSLHINDKKLSFEIKVYLFKYIRVYKKEGETDDYIKKTESLFNDNNLKEKSKTKNTSKTGFMDVLSKINVVISTYCLNKERFTKLRHYTQKKLKMKKVEISIKEGASDAAETGIYYGVIWSLLGSVSAVFSNFMTIIYKKINILCDYNNKTFKAEINCIISFSLANIIIVFIRLYYLIKKYKQNINQVSTGGGNNE